MNTPSSIAAGGTTINDIATSSPGWPLRDGDVTLDVVTSPESWLTGDESSENDLASITL